MGSPGGRSAVVIACWYTANVGVLLLNKYILSVYGFRFPVFMTLCHMCMCSVLSAAAREFKIVPKQFIRCLLYTSPSPRDATLSRMPSSA